MDKELRDRLYWLQDELTEEERRILFDDVETEEERSILSEDAEEEEEPEFIAPPQRRKLTRAEKIERQKLEELNPIEERSVPVAKKKGIKGLVFLAVLEVIGILCILGWWLQWLI